MAAVTLLEIGSAGIKSLILGGDSMSEFDRAVASLFVAPEYFDAFNMGIVVVLAVFVLGSIGFGLIDVAIDLIRDKLGLPVARYVRWVKDYDNLDK